MFEKEKTPIYIGSDHAGFDVKEDLKKFLEGEKFHITDLGCFSPDSCDYPDIAREVSEKVLEVENSFGILLCGTGIGMCMAANRLRGIRAAFVNNLEDAEMARKHNNANIVCMGARTTDFELIKQIVDKFLTTEFESDHERHVRRVMKMDRIPDK